MSDIIEQKCELFNICDCKTAMCRTCLPDESCYYYRYFKKIRESYKTIFERMKEIKNKEGNNE